MKLSAFVVVFVLHFVGSAFGDDRRANFHFYTENSDRVVEVIYRRFPSVIVHVENTNSGTSVTLICSGEEGRQIRQILDEQLGRKMVRDWNDLTPHKWKTVEGEKLVSSFTVPPHRMKVLEPEALDALDAGHRADLADDLKFFLETRWSRGMSPREMQIHQAVRALGHLKSPVAVPILAEHLDFVPPGIPSDPKLPNEHPCAVALARIGESSADAMIRKIASTEDERERKLAAWVLLHAVGNNQEKAFERLDLSRQSVPAAVRMFDEARDFIRAFNNQWKDKAAALIDQ